MKSSPGKVLLTGGAGFIGSHTARLLVELGYEVTMFGRGLTKGYNRLGGGPEWESNHFACEYASTDD